jgi:hypothetical protein
VCERKGKDVGKREGEREGEKKGFKVARGYLVEKKFLRKVDEEKDDCKHDTIVRTSIVKAKANARSQESPSIHVHMYTEHITLTCVILSIPGLVSRG